MRWRVAAGLDGLAVLVFVAIGRASHDEAASITGFANTAWPFLAGLGIGWAVTRAWRDPAAMTAGLGVWVVTVAGGMVLRAVSGQGTAVAFVIVATLFLAMELLGWRAVARWAPVARRRRSRA